MRWALICEAQIRFSSLPNKRSPVPYLACTLASPPFKSLSIFQQVLSTSTRIPSCSCRMTFRITWRRRSGHRGSWDACYIKFFILVLIRDHKSLWTWGFLWELFHGMWRWKYFYLRSTGMRKSCSFSNLKDGIIIIIFVLLCLIVPNYNFYFILILKFKKYYFIFTV